MASVRAETWGVDEPQLQLDALQLEGEGDVALEVTLLRDVVVEYGSRSAAELPPVRRLLVWQQTVVEALAPPLSVWSWNETYSSARLHCVAASPSSIEHFAAGVTAEHPRRTDGLCSAKTCRCYRNVPHPRVRAMEVCGVFG